MPLGDTPKDSRKQKEVYRAYAGIDELKGCI